MAETNVKVMLVDMVDNQMSNVQEVNWVGEEGTEMLWKEEYDK